MRWGVPEDALMIAALLESRGVPCWMAFEERFVVAERDGKLVAVLRFREAPGLLHLGLLIAEPWAEEDGLTAALYAGARNMARGLGVREIRAHTSRHQTHLREAGYPRWGKA